MRGKGRGLGQLCHCLGKGPPHCAYLIGQITVTWPPLAARGGWGLDSGWSLAQLNMGSFPMEGDDRHGGREEVCAFLMSIEEPGRSDFQ